jgi:NhaA family Na+:H+ antiporter
VKPSSGVSALPAQPIRTLVRPLEHFLRIESANGVVLLVCTLAALALANSPWAEAYHDFWHTHLSVSLGQWKLDHSLAHWVNDGLMTIFFFVVGLEIKRELVLGELRDPRQAALPIVAAVGGMLAPAAIYYLLQHGQPGERGWGIPMATDIAFVVGILALLGKRVPIGLKILLLALAIADDIGAVLVIAIFYTTSISVASLALAAVGFGFVLAMRWLGVRQVRWYVLVGTAIWFAFLMSGVHPTVAGVVLGLMTPARPWVPSSLLQHVLDTTRGEADSRHRIAELRIAAHESTSPLERLEHGLHPWVAFGIMPIFALANAGVRIEAAELTNPIALAVAAGLVLGKPLGIALACLLAVRAGLARLPAGVNWLALLGGGCLGGIGFTMSLFVAGLALEGELLEAGKLGTLAGSAMSAMLGCGLLVGFLPAHVPNDDLNPAETAATSGA